MIDAQALRMGELLRWALAHLDPTAGQAPEHGEAHALLIEQQRELERFEAWLGEMMTDFDDPFADDGDDHGCECGCR